MTGVNDGPVAVNDAVTTAEDTAVSVAVLANDTDLDGDSVTVTAVSAPAHGTAAVNADGTITYTPAANYNGADSFSYTIGDGNGGTATATVSVTVTAANDAPVAADDTATTAEDTPVTIAVLANDTDPDGDTLSVGGVLGAEPSIATTAGSWSHGAAVTIAGSGFGVKPLAAPTVWDDASGAHTSDKWDAAWPSCDGNGTHNLAYRTPEEVGRNIALPHGHTSRYIAGAHFGPVPGPDCGYTVMMWKVRTIASFPAYSVRCRGTSGRTTTGSSGTTTTSRRLPTRQVRGRTTSGTTGMRSTTRHRRAQPATPPGTSTTTALAPPLRAWRLAI